MPHDRMPASSICPHVFIAGSKMCSRPTREVAKKAKKPGFYSDIPLDLREPSQKINWKPSEVFDVEVRY